ncbi:hypothetical protein [Caballeronia sp. RCC_10]|uniref:hypothetical protein n=1 Tax=Caballeronia sp. RCC_10 TaxID=3239227 RepID=UPI00352534C0
MHRHLNELAFVDTRLETLREKHINEDASQWDSLDVTLGLLLQHSAVGQVSHRAPNMFRWRRRRVAEGLVTVATKRYTWFEKYRVTSLSRLAANLELDESMFGSPPLVDC